MDALQSLVQKSFVRQVADTRFDLLVSVKEYALEHLRTEGRYLGSGPAALRAVEVRHGAYFVGLDEMAVMNVIRGVEIDNFVVACRRAVARGDGDVAANALERAWWSLTACGPYRVAVELASIVRATPGLGSAATALVEFVAGASLWDCGKESEGYAHLEAALVSARRVGDRRTECRALMGLGHMDNVAGRMKGAHSRLEAALAVARESRDRILEPRVRDLLGRLEASQSRISEAQAHFDAALELARQVGDRSTEGDILGGLGRLCLERGDMDKGRSHFEKAFALGRQMANRSLEGGSLCHLGWCNQLQGRLYHAHGQLEAALAVARDLGDVRFESDVLWLLGKVYESMVRPDNALDHFEAGLVIARELGDRVLEGQFLGYLGRLHARQARFDEARSCLNAGEPLLRAGAGPASLAMFLCGRAEMEHVTGNPNGARVALAEADTLASAVAAGPSSELGPAIARVRDLLGK
jgi:tetratricopeptide (TPR) repeat protein